MKVTGQIHPCDPVSALGCCYWLDMKPLLNDPVLL